MEKAVSRDWELVMKGIARVRCYLEGWKMDQMAMVSFGQCLCFVPAIGMQHHIF